MSNINITEEEIPASFLKDKRRIESLEKSAEKYSDQGNFHKACNTYEKIVQLDPLSEKSWISLGHCYYIIQDYKKCYAAYQKGMNTFKGRLDPQLWYGLGMLCQKFSYYDQAEMSFQESLKCDPDFEQKQNILLKLGILSKQALKYEEAINLFKSCIQCDSRNINIVTQAYCCMGFCYNMLGSIGESLLSYRYAVSVESNQYTLACLGWELLSLGHFDEAHQCLEYASKAENKTENYEEKLYYMLAMSNLQKNKFEVASEYFEKILKKNSYDFSACCSYGILKAKQSKQSEAVQLLFKADQAGTKAEAWLNLGVLYEQCGQIEDAIVAYQKALTLKNYELIAQERINNAGTGKCNCEMLIHPLFDPTEIIVAKIDNNSLDSKNKDFTWIPPPEFFAWHAENFYQGFMNFMQNMRNCGQFDGIMIKECNDEEQAEIQRGENDIDSTQVAKGRKKRKTK
ncbi:unnamed protein product [Blepharisma stoltei]|uniref:Bacterial transcriptional activator domain-containing protein n=1 Tax=Blepharisma stoltei TaxID=1481888 RepID=A0AAU9IQF9_9CILI|nr:unnamed protein product [Blepharisma stoltei]